MSSRRQEVPVLQGAIPPLLMTAAGTVMMALPFMIEKELGISPADLDAGTKFCVMVTTFSGLAIFMRGTSALLTGPRPVKKQTGNES